MSNFYSTLHITRHASAELIKASYRMLAMIHHPDRGGSHDDFDRITKAYETLSDPIKRAEYDHSLPFEDNAREGVSTSTVLAMLERAKNEKIKAESRYDRILRYVLSQNPPEKHEKIHRDLKKIDAIEWRYPEFESLVKERFSNLGGDLRWHWETLVVEALRQDETLLEGFRNSIKVGDIAKWRSGTEEVPAIVISSLAKMAIPIRHPDPEPEPVIVAEAPAPKATRDIDSKRHSKVPTDSWLTPDVFDKVLKTMDSGASRMELFTFTRQLTGIALTDGQMDGAFYNQAPLYPIVVPSAASNAPHKFSELWAIGSRLTKLMKKGTKNVQWRQCIAEVVGFDTRISEHNFTPEEIADLRTRYHALGPNSPPKPRGIRKPGLGRGRSNPVDAAMVKMNKQFLKNPTGFSEKQLFNKCLHVARNTDNGIAWKRLVETEEVVLVENKSDPEDAIYIHKSFVNDYLHAISE